MNPPETDRTFGWLVDRLGTAVLVFVAVGVMGTAAAHLLGRGIDNTLTEYYYWVLDPETGQYSGGLLLTHIDFVAIPVAAIAAARLRWGAEWIAAPGTSPTRPLFPLLGAVVLCAVFSYWGWWGLNPHDLFGIHPQFGVQRWISVALMAGVGYFGMMLFPRLTASMAGTVAGPALFALVGYILFPSLMEDPAGRLADVLAIVFLWGALAVAIAAVLTMVVYKRLRRHPLGYALWTGALMLCLAVAGTFSGSYIGR